MYVCVSVCVPAAKRTWRQSLMKDGQCHHHQRQIKVVVVVEGGSDVVVVVEVTTVGKTPPRLDVGGRRGEKMQRNEGRKTRCYFLSPHLLLLLHLHLHLHHQRQHQRQAPAEAMTHCLVLYDHCSGGACVYVGVTPRSSSHCWCLSRKKKMSTQCFHPRPNSSFL